MFDDRSTGDAHGPACRGCAMGECPASGEAEEAGPVAGWRLGMASLGLFVGPVVLAILGAACCRGSQAGQLLGGVAGLVVGMIGSVVIARRLPRLLRVEPPKKTA
jgi:hypothetical protein